MGPRAQPSPDFPVQPWAPSQSWGLPTWCPPLRRWLWSGRAGSWCGGGCHQLTPSQSSLSTPTSAAGTEPGVALPIGRSWRAPLCGSGAVLLAAPARPTDGARCPLSWPAPRPACRGPSSAAPAAPAGGRSPGRGWCSWMGRDALCTHRPQSQGPRERRVHVLREEGWGRRVLARGSVPVEG